ncbi:MAG: nuclear transport factor 2 family protein [Betaproteobacteria bacterium]|nr:nuclear transport factor 2 family protein [Betaproteobacteria bacterium]
MDTKDFEALLQKMTASICAGDAQAAAACFAPDGVYHDGFYGEFSGRAEIARMLTDFFWRDAQDFEWTISDAVSDGKVGYATYDFSYTSKIPGTEGRRVGFSGISCCRLEAGLIKRYGEQFERAPALVRLGFSDERILKSVKRWAKAP